MGHHLAGRRLLAVAAAIVALGVALAVPSTALAKTTFSSKLPAPSYTSTHTVMTVSVYVVDSYGIKGSTNFSLTIDGKKVTPKITYKKKGDYKRVTLSYRITSALKVASHTISVKIKNRRGKTASTSWTFKVILIRRPHAVLPPESVVTTMPISISGSDCTACHVGYPAAHPMTNCAGCHGTGAPPRPVGSPYPGQPMNDYISTWSAHIPSCAAGRCHTGLSSVFPHVLDGDCGRCHNDSRYQLTIPQQHPVDAESAHASSSTRCTSSGCHIRSLTVEHYRYSVGGVKLSCRTCHSSTDPRIIAAIRSKSTACESCHDLLPTHPASAKSHTLAATPSCVGTGCHTGGSNVTAIHSAIGCTACHAAGKNPSLACETCHVADGHPPHTSTAAPATMTISGVAYGVHACTECHPDTDLRGIHGGTAGCGKCHPTAAATATPWLGGCVQGTCHVSGTFKMHATIDASHTLSAAPGCTVTGCHAGGKNVAAIHAAVKNRTDSGCGLCHADGVTPTLVCATAGCHLTGASAIHSSHPSSVTSVAITINSVTYAKLACTACHASTELQAAHGGANSCGTCHPSPRDSITAAWNGTCVQGDCHKVDTPLSMHASVNASHTVNAASACTLSGCHVGGTDVAAIHYAVTGRTDSGCGICHVPGKQATTQCAAAGCHPSNTNALHSSHPATITSGTITINTVSYGKHLCSECHATTELQTVHGGTTGCSNCHPKPRDSITKWDGGCVQGGCHSSGALTMHGSLNASHTVSAAPSCTAAAGCHTGGSDVAAIHKATGRSDSGCPICHTPGKQATAVCATTGCHPNGAPSDHASHPATITSGTVTILGASYGKHLCSECHVTTELQAVHGGATSCAKCHPSPRNSFTDWNGACVQGGCHVVNTKLAMHGSIDTSHTAPAGACVQSNCHVSDVAKLHAPGPGCAACHGVGKTPSLVCSACHVADPHPAHTSNVPAATMRIGGVDFGTHACSECHAADLRELHGGSTGCSKCHPSPRNTFLIWNDGCVQGGCHIVGTKLAMHGSIDTSHTAPTGACVSTGCHVSNVATLHAPGPGCAACHKAGVTATLTCTASACHPNGAPSSHGSHPATITSGTITINSVAYTKLQCSLCHATTELQAVHGGPTSCGKCHPSPRNTFTDWNGACVQGGCHVANTPLAMHGSVNASHTVSAASACSATGCHTGGSDIAAIHFTVPGRTDSGCGICHAPGKKATSVCATTDCHPAGGDLNVIHVPYIGTSHDVTSTACVSECHLADVVAIHGAPGGPGCAACHVSGKTPTLVCASCHAGHGLTVHPNTTTAHVAPAGPCVTAGCHTSNVMTLHGEGGGSGCSQCHSAHVQSGFPGCAACHKPGLVPVLTCTAPACHPNGLSAKHTSHPATITTGAITINTVSYGTHSCSECHATTELQAVHGGTTSCSKCHPSPRNSFTTWNGACVQGGCHVATGTLAMHGSINTAHNSADTAACTVAGCHNGPDVAAIHKTVRNRTDSGCGICHVPGKQATAICATAGCHPSGAPSGHASHPATVTTGTIVINHVSYGRHYCTECHTMELQTLHDGATGCANCHPTPRDSITTAWNGGCVQGACHAAGSPLALHLMVTPSHITTSTTCAGTGCHGADLAAVHGVTGGPGCVACHHAGQRLTLDCSATGCHPDGAPASHNSHPSSVTTGTIRILGTDYPNHACTECHPSTELQTVHGLAGSCVKCHPSPRNSFTDWNGTCVQGNCHKVGTTLAMHGSADASHTALTAPSCTASCHTGGSDVAKIHATKGGCAACHGAGKTPTLECDHCHSSDLLTVHTPYIGTKHDLSAGGCVTDDCHAGVDAATLHANSTLGCAACHAANKTASLDCTTCHTGDIGTVHATAIGTKHQVSSAACVTGSCHQGKDAAALHAPSIGCAACHAKGKTASVECLDCHRSGIAADHPSGNTGHINNTHPCDNAACHPLNSAADHAFTNHSCEICHSTTPAKSSRCTNCHSYAWAAAHTGYSMSKDYHGSAIGTGSDVLGMGFYSTGWILPPYTRGNVPNANANLPCSACHDVDGTRNYYNFPNVVNGKPVTVTSGYEYVNLCVACHGGTVDQWHAGCFDCHLEGHGSTPGWTVEGRDCSQCHGHAHSLTNSGLRWPHGPGLTPGPTL